MLKEILSAALNENHLDFNETIRFQWIHYLELLQKWNRVFNLTSIDQPREMIYLHLLDSLSILPHLHGTRCLDVGSGGGLPGIPLAIADPSKTWVLLDKNAKKTRFLTQVIAELGLANVTVACHRVEDFQSAACFDSIISRALGTLALLVTGAEHLICPQGYFLAMKGIYPEEELKEIPARYTIQVEKLNIKGLTAERHLVKVNATPNK